MYTFIYPHSLITPVPIFIKNPPIKIFVDSLSDNGIFTVSQLLCKNYLILYILLK